jgi:hypothetical protein
MSDTRSLGAIFSPHATEFGVDYEDLVFTFSSTTGETLVADVVYEGDKRHNNLVVIVDPVSGHAVLENQSTVGVTIDAYTITSDAGSLLTTWNSLEDQEAGGGDWFEIEADATKIGELKRTGATTLAEGDTFNFGAVFDTVHDQDLIFDFLFANQSTPTQGIVIYREFAGDLNGDGAINFGDLTPFVKALTDPDGYATMFPGLDRVARCDTSGDGACNFADLTPFVELLSGSPASGRAVPEPSTVLLWGVACAACIGRRCSLRRQR